MWESVFSKKPRRLKLFVFLRHNLIEKALNFLLVHKLNTILIGKQYKKSSFKFNDNAIKFSFERGFK